MENKTTVLLDVDDTLLDFKECSLHSLKQAFQACDIEYKDEYHRVFIEINARLWQELERQEITKEELFKRRFQQVFVALNIEGDSDKAELIFRNELSASHIPMHHALELLEYLKDKYTLYVVSNSAYQRQVDRLTKAGFAHYFKDIYTSERVGAIKPSKDFFEACFKEMKISKEEAIMIGDSYTADIVGAMNYGIDAIWFHQETSEEEITQVKDLLEIREIL